MTQTSVGCGTLLTAAKVGPLRMRRLLAVPLAVLALAAPAQADTWTVTDGSSDASTPACNTTAHTCVSLRTAIAAFEAVDPNLVDASRTLGAGPGGTFARVALPLASGGLGAGAALSFARGLGEFGATIMFAGSLQGVTQTLSLAVYEQFDVDFDTALAIGAELVIVSAAVLLAVKLVPAWRRSSSDSTTLFAPTPSS